MEKAKTYQLTVTVLEKPDYSFTCECARSKKVEAHFTFLTTGTPPVVIAESYLCSDCAKEVRGS